MKGILALSLCCWASQQKCWVSLKIPKLLILYKYIFIERPTITTRLPLTPYVQASSQKCFTLRHMPWEVSVSHKISTLEPQSTLFFISTIQEIKQSCKITWSYWLVTWLDFKKLGFSRYAKIPSRVKRATITTRYFLSSTLTSMSTTPKYPKHGSH